MLPNKEGKRVPDVIFKTRVGDEWVDVPSANLFNGKTVVVFSLPGAYAPTSSLTHLPRYNELAPALKASGVNDVICISVNDAFVMQEWGKVHEADGITLIPDGNGKFTEGMGMLVDKSSLGCGMRSWRYSMLVKDGVIQKMFIEPERDGDPFEVSDADTMLQYVSSNTKASVPVTIFTKPGCPFCARAKDMLTQAHLHFEEISLDKGVTSRSLLAVAGAGTAPQIFVGGKKIGGFEALQAWLKTNASA